MSLSAGERLGAYEVIELLGAGGMGEVYRARDTRLGRDVAIKVLPEAFARDTERLARFEREAKTVASLNHANIVVLHSVEEARGIRFLTMELVEGQSLDRLVTSGGLPLPRVLDLGIALAEALVAAHERGVVHRDLKPANAMVTRDGRVKVLDFGLAKIAVPESVPDASGAMTLDDALSSAGQVVGSVPYMAPEQVRGGTVDARTDLFALGILLYELASGRRPFTGATRVEVGAAILRDTPEPLASERADIPSDLDRIIRRCLEKEPRARFQTALDVCNELRDLQRSAQARFAPPATPGVAAIAVLPFVNLSGDPENDYFSDGLAEELLNVLAKIRGLRVAARTSSSTFKGKGVTIAEAGRALNVGAVLEGSVRKAGNRVRIAVTLAKVSDGFHLWSETYDRTLEDIFAVQDDIAQSVVRQLRTTLLGEKADSKLSGAAEADVAMAARGRGRNAEAHRLYLQARYFLERRTHEELANGIGYLIQALDLDPDNAQARTELGRAFARESDYGWVPVAEGYGRARAEVDRALSLEPDLAEGRELLGWMQMIHDWDWRAAQASYARALELAPGNALVLRGAGVLAWNLGHLDESIGFFSRAVEQDPLSSASYHNLGLALEAADRFEDADEAFRKASELSPQRVLTRAHRSLILFARGREIEAVDEALREPHEAFRLWALAIIHHGAGRAADSDAALAELQGKHGGDSAYQIAEVCAARREADATFEWLERAYAERDGGLAELKTSPRLRALHSDPRWPAFLGRLGLAD